MSKISHDFFNKSTNNQNIINENVTEAPELEFVNDRFTNSENDMQTRVKDKRGGGRYESDIPNNTSPKPDTHALRNADSTSVIETIDNKTSAGYNLFLMSFDEREQLEIDEALTYDPANIPRCYEALFDIAAALRKFGRVLGKDTDEDMHFYELLFVIWHGLYSEYIIS